MTHPNIAASGAQRGRPVNVTRGNLAATGCGAEPSGNISQGNIAAGRFQLGGERRVGKAFGRGIERSHASHPKVSTSGRKRNDAINILSSDRCHRTEPRNIQRVAARDMNFVNHGAGAAISAHAVTLLEKHDTSRRPMSGERKILEKGASIGGSDSCVKLRVILRAGLRVGVRVGRRAGLGVRLQIGLPISVNAEAHLIRSIGEDLHAGAIGFDGELKPLASGDHACAGGRGKGLSAVSGIREKQSAD